MQGTLIAPCYQEPEGRKAGNSVRPTGGLLREMAESIGVSVFPAKWVKHYLERRIATCGPDAVDRRAILLTRLMSLANRQRDFASAEAAGRAILLLIPDDPWTPIELALILERRGDLVGAKRLYEQAAGAAHVSPSFRARALAEVDRLNAAGL